MSFSCPHFCPSEEQCLRLKTDCVLTDPSAFAVPVAERLRAKEREKRHRALLGATPKQHPD
jgi:hypothetical protein